MVKKIRNIFLILVFLISFYVVKKIVFYSMVNDNLYKKIESESVFYETKYINAEINDNKIVPGLKGTNINKEKSYYKMKNKEIFDSYYLIYDYVMPEISLENNLDKYIEMGNKAKNSVAFILDNKEIQKYFQNNNIKGDILIELNDFDKNSYFEQINNDINNFRSVDILMKDSNTYNKICVLKKYEIEASCRKNNYYLVTPKITIRNNNLLEIKSKIDSGSIIYVEKDAKLEDVKYIINDINFHGYKIVYLSELISENRY